MEEEQDDVADNIFVVSKLKAKWVSSYYILIRSIGSYYLLIAYDLFCIQIFRIRRKKMATKEEELQKKREEAERKARRGEIDPTHEFTFQVFISVHRFENHKFTVKNWIRNDENLTFCVWYRLLPSSVDCFAMRLWISCFRIRPCWMTWISYTSLTRHGISCFTIR